MLRNRILIFLAFLLLLATWQTPGLDAAVSRLKTWIAAETLTASDLNAEFNNLLNNGEDLGWPATKAKDLDGQQLILDGDQDTHITSDTDDRVDFSLGGFDGVRFDGTTASSVNGFDLATQSTGVAPEIKSRGEANIGWELQDSNGNEIVIGNAVASAVNEITIENATTGNAPTIRSTGEADIGLEFQNSDSEETLILASVSTAVNEITITNAATGNAPLIQPSGETNTALALKGAGTGQVQIGDASLNYPDSDGSASQFLQTDGSASLSFASIAVSDLPAGTVVQMVNTQDGAVATGTTAMPQDNTIPQNTEGDEYMTLAVTPKSATNTLLIDVVVHGSHSSANNGVHVGLFQDTTADALAGGSITILTATHGGMVSFRHKMTSGTTSATTFKVRAGGTAGATFTFNGSSGTVTFGGVTASSITIWEIAQ